MTDKEALDEHPLIMVNPNGTAAPITALRDTTDKLRILPSSYAHQHKYMNPEAQRIVELEAEVKKLTARLDEFEKQLGWLRKEAGDGPKDEGV